MGLLSIIRKQKLKEKEIRVLMLGLDNSGKTTIVRSLLGRDINEIAPTMGFNIDTIAHNGFNVNIWDIGGQSTLRAFWYNYFERTDFLVWVVDASSLQRLQESFKEFANVLEEDRLVGCGLAIVINKIDIYQGDRKQLEEAVIEKLGLRSLKNHDWSVFCASGYTGEGLKTVMDWIVQTYDLKYYIMGS